MKRVKSIIGIAMIAVLAVAMCAFSASAAMTLNVNVDKTQLEPGDTVTATVSVENYETVLAGFAVTIEYDKAALTLTNVTPENYGGEAVVDPEDLADADGSITIVWFTADPAGIANVNKLADLTFTAKAETDSAAISAGFKSDGMVSAGDTPEPILPSEGIYSDETVNAPSIEVVPEGSLGGGEDPVEGNTGSMAGESTGAAGSSQIDVKGIYSIGERTQMYRVVIDWGSMTFTYTEADETWNPGTHAWELDDENAVGTWAPAEDGVTNKIGFENHSSQPVSVTFGFEDDLAEDTITPIWSAEQLNLDAVAGLGNEAVVDEDAVTLNLSGKFTNETAESIVIGEATATIA